MKRGDGMEWWQILIFVIVGGLVVDNAVTNICKAYVLTHQKGEKNGSEDL